MGVSFSVGILGYVSLDHFLLGLTGVFKGGGYVWQCVYIIVVLRGYLQYG